FLRGVRQENIGVVTMRNALSERVAVKRCWPHFLVSDLYETETFCREKLGFEVAYEEPDHDFAIYCRDDVFLMFRQSANVPPASDESYASIEVSNVAAMRAELRDRGAQPSPIVNLPYGRET